MPDLSLLRVVGLIVGVALMVANFLYHRGPRWRRTNFVMASLASLALITVSIDPNVIDGLPRALSLDGFAYGRLLSLAIVTSFAAVLLAFYTKARADHLHRVLDRVVCGDTAERALASPQFPAQIKPVVILIAALNEEHNLDILLPRIPREINGTAVDVLVIDDGSHDRTSEVAARHGCLVARNVVNRGQGAAFRVGYAILHRVGCEFAVTMDADNQHRPEDLPAMISPLLNGKADFVIGSRRLGSADAGSAIRSIGVLVLSRLISVLSAQTITDCSSGFRGFRMSAMSRLHLHEDQYQTSEVILEAAKKGLRILEVPIHINLRMHGESRKGPSMSYGFYFVKTMLKTWWR